MIKFCPNCGKEVNSKFCPYCGCEISKVIVEDPADTAPVIETPAADIPEQEAPAEDIPVISFGSGDQQTAQPESEEAVPDFSTEPAPDFHAEPAPGFNFDPAPAQEPQQNYNTYYIPPEHQKESVTHKTWFIVLFLILFWPLGLFFMWRAKKFSKAARIIITVIIGILFILNIIATIGILATADEYYDDYDIYDDYDYSYDYDSDNDDYSYDSGALVDGRTAAEAAQSYLNALNFSREGLIEQLEYEGYTNSDAAAAVDSLSVDWNEQAAGSARNYLDVFPDMSRSEMIDQLEYEGYTYSQAVYGADAAGL